METSDDTPNLSKATKSIEQICSQYDKIISKLQSAVDEDDEEERWLLKESTKDIAAHLEKQIMPEAKRMAELIRILNIRVRMLIEKCERVFPQLEEMPRLKSIQSELEQILATTPQTQSMNCPVCAQFPNLRLQTSSSSQNGNVFLYVAEKLANSGRSGGASGSTDFSKESEKISPDAEFIGGKAPEPADSSDDTVAVRTRTNRSDNASIEDGTKRMDLLWTEDGDNLDLDANQRSPKRKRKRRRRRTFGGRRSPMFEGGPLESSHCAKCEKHNSAPPTPTPAISPNKSIPTPPLLCPVTFPLGEKSEPKDSVGSQRLDERTSNCPDRLLILVLVLIAITLNLVVYCVQRIFQILFSTNSWLGSTIWPAYCNVLNHYCRRGHEIACREYCASRLDLSLWQKK